MDTLYTVALGLVPGVGSLLARQLLAHFGSAKAIFDAPKGKLQRVPGIGEILASQIVKKETVAKAEELIASVHKLEACRLVTITDPDYPKLLREIPDAPVFLYWQGNTAPNFDRAVAIVGTRQATEYGKEVTETIVSQLSVYKPLIVSGFAYGIDIVAHKAALRCGLETVAVLGSGLGNIYPSQHKKYVRDLCLQGALVTEYQHSAKPDARHFPARNRIVAGMVSAVIVVEAAEKGGALITAELANSYHREVFAVPGSLGNKFSEGCNKLIRNNLASIFTSVEDLVENLGWEREGAVISKNTLLDTSLMSNDQVQVCTLLNEHGEMHIDTLSWKSQLSMNQLAGILLEMELNGWVKPLPGKKFKIA